MDWRRRPGIWTVTLAFVVVASCSDSERTDDDGDAGEGGGGSSAGTVGGAGVAGNLQGGGGAVQGGASGNGGEANRAGMSGSGAAGSAGASGGNAGGGGEGGEAGAGADAGAGGAPDGGGSLPNCTTSGWCWENPVPGGSHLTGIWAGASDNVWAVGYGGLILRYDGERWQRFAGPTTQALYTVWGTATDAVWVGGSGGLFFWNGTSFVNYSSTQEVLDLHGSAANNVRSAHGTDAIDYFDGTRLKQPNRTGLTHSAVALWTYEPNVVYGATNGGAIIRASGPFALPSDYSVTAVYQGAGAPLRDLWGTMANEPLWAVGDSGRVVAGQGTTFRLVDAGTTAWLSGVWGSSQTDIWVVGEVGTILHYDGMTWTNHSLATKVDLKDIDGTGWNDVWAVGTNGSIFHFDGLRWSTPNSLTHQELWGVWGTSDEDVWAVGDRGVVLHKDVNGWRALASPTTARIGGVYAVGPNDAWLTSDDSRLYHFTGAGFEVGFTLRYYSSFVWGRAADDIWTSGGGDVHRYNGDTWEPFPLPFNGYEDMWASSATDIWFSRGSSGYYHLKDGVATSGNDFSMGYLWGTGPDDMWSAHDNSGIRHWDGQSWTIAPGSSLSAPNAMWGIAPDDLWIVGDLGTTDYFDGEVLQHLTTTNGDELDATLNAVWVSPGGRAYAVGQAGTIVTHEPIAQ